MLPDIGPKDPDDREYSDGSYFSHRKNTIKIDRRLGSESAILERVLRHELSHFSLHVSTPYGFALDQICAAQKTLVVTYAIRHLRDCPGAKIVRPVYQFAKAYYADRDAWADKFPAYQRCKYLIKKFVRPWAQLAFLDGELMEGRDRVDGPPTSFLSAVDAVRTLESVGSEALFDLEIAPPSLRFRRLRNV